MQKSMKTINRIRIECHTSLTPNLLAVFHLSLLTKKQYTNTLTTFQQKIALPLRSYQHQQTKTMNDTSEFYGGWDIDGTSCESYGRDADLIRFHVKHVHLKVLSAGDDSYSKFLIDSGQVVLWRNEKDNALSLGFLKRSSMNDKFPTLVVPIVLVVYKKCSYFDGTRVGDRVQFVLKTSCSLDTRKTIKPMDVTFYLNKSDTLVLDKEMAYSSKKWPP